jgi:cysteinyl-tRNA synthetase
MHDWFGNPIRYPGRKSMSRMQPPRSAWIVFLACWFGLAAGLSSSMAQTPAGARIELAQARDMPQKADPASARRRQRLNTVKHWGYWLSSFDINEVVGSPHDLMVVDNGVSANRRFKRGRSPSEVASMKQRPNGGPRVLLSYLSIGEAERYRPYWRPEWHDEARRPPWLGKVNPNWDGNYAVQYWHPEWQGLIFGTPESYLDIIMDQGFDGVYLDRADAFLQWEATQPQARADMARFIRALADYARQKNPDFLVVMQNAEELLDDPKVLEAIDGIAKEDLLYGVDDAEQPNRPEDVKYSLQQLRFAKDAGRKVLVVEYLSDPAKMEEAARVIRSAGFVPYFARRLLNCLNPPAIADAGGALPPHPCQ